VLNNYDVDYKTFVVHYDGNGSDSVTLPADDSAYNPEAGVAVKAGEPAKSGYKFAGWTLTKSGKEANGSDSPIYKSGDTVSKPAANPNVTFWAQWMPDVVPALYRIEHYYVGASGTPDTEPFATDDLIGVTGAAVTAAAKTGLTGYAYRSDFTGTLSGGTIAADGSLILKLYYPVNRHFIFYSYIGAVPPGAPSLPSDVTNVAYGTARTVAANLSMSGYIFSGWISSDIAASDDGSFTMPDKNVSFTGSWTAVTTYTVSYRQGTRGTFTETTYPGLSLGAATPAAPYPYGRSGWDFDGWYPARSAAVTGDVIYTAQWTRESNGGGEGGGGGGTKTDPTPGPKEEPTAPETPEPETSGPETPGEPVIPGPDGPGPGGDDGGGGGGGGGTTGPDTDSVPEPSPGGITETALDAPPPAPSPDIQPAQALPEPAETENAGSELITQLPAPLVDVQRFLTEIFDGKVPLANLFGNEVPLFSPLGEGAWALVNLLLSIIGAMCAVAGAGRALLRKKKREAREATDDTHKPEAEEKRYRLICLATAILLGIAGVAVFLLTEDTGNPMVLIDNWTLVHILMLAAEIAAVALAFKTFMKTVIFETYTGSAFRQKVRSGDTLQEPSTPSNPNHIFAGWFTDETFDDTLWDFQSRVKKNLKLYAKWNETRVVPG
jgi:uncharacterized repeat protein (TIGR02543 family)